MHQVCTWLALLVLACIRQAQAATFVEASPPAKTRNRIVRRGDDVGSIAVEREDSGDEPEQQALSDEARGARKHFVISDQGDALEEHDYDDLLVSKSQLDCLNSSNSSNSSNVSGIRFRYGLVSGPGGEICNGQTLWSGNTSAGQDACEAECSSRPTCRFYSFSNGNMCMLTSRCDGRWKQAGKTIWIYEKQVPGNNTVKLFQYVTFHLTLLNLDYSKLLANATLLEAVQASMKEAIVVEAGNGTTTEDVVLELSPGSVVVEVSITCPEGLAPGVLISRLNTSSVLGPTIAAKVAQLEGIASMCTSTTEGECTDLLKVSNITAPKLVLAGAPEKERANETEENGTSPMVPKCADQEVTGLEFVNGSEASCSVLSAYCNHSKYGSKVRDACLQTCGFCSLEKAAGSSCVDGNITDSPLFEHYNRPGELVDCKDLKALCWTHARVKVKCRATCGTCNTPNLTATTATTTFGGYGCSRRRLVGACQTRRRRQA